jgi:PDZ domain-containing protein
MTDDLIPPPSAPPVPPAGPTAAPGFDGAEPGASLRRAVPTWLKWFAGIGTVLIAIGIAGTVIRLPYTSFAPGAALDVAPLVTVRGAQTYSDSGDVMLLFVRERRHVNVWAWLQATLDPDIDLAKDSDVSGGQSDEENNAAAISQMTQSQISAKAAALTALGYHLRTAPGVLVTAVLPSKPAGKALHPGDQILAADGHELKEPTDLGKLVGRHRVGTSVSLRILRAGRTETVPVRVVASGKNGKRIIGVLVLQTFRFPFRIDIDTKGISGPSAGLAMALAVVDEKGISAKGAHAQIFLVPACGKDAVCSEDLRRLKQRGGEHVDVEPVATLAQALRVLRDAGGVPVSTTSTSGALRSLR